MQSVKDHTLIVNDNDHNGDDDDYKYINDDSHLWLWMVKKVNQVQSEAVF